MNIWVDADACPGAIKEILFRAAARTGLPMTLVANKGMWIPKADNVRLIQVGSGLDVADNEIVKRMEAGDLVITADIPLASEVIAKGGHPLNPRGELLTEESIGERLSIRDFMDGLRSSGVNTGGPAPLGAKDRQAFADALDRFLARNAR